MGKHYLYAVDVKREVTIYQRVTIAIPESIPEGDREAYIDEAIADIDAQAELCNHHEHDDMQEEEVEIVDANLLDDGVWTLNEETDWAMNDKGSEEYVHRAVEE